MLKYLIRSDVGSFWSCVSCGNMVPFSSSSHKGLLVVSNVSIDTLAKSPVAAFNWHNFLNRSYLVNVNCKVELAPFLLSSFSLTLPSNEGKSESWDCPRSMRVLWSTEISSPVIVQEVPDPAGEELMFSKFTSLCASVIVGLHREISKATELVWWYPGHT